MMTTAILILDLEKINILQVKSQQEGNNPLFSA